ncbi:MAG: trehalose-phosphatase [Bryobacteraceae bacterium]
MSYLFAPSQREVLDGFARSKVFLAFDFDGTLAPIVDHPRDAAMRPCTKNLLRRVTRLYPCAVISGRSRADVRPRLSGTGVQVIVGNHGADLGDTRGLTRRVARWGAVLEKELAGLEGVWVENKGLSLAVHYRNSPQKRETRRRLQDIASVLDGARFAPAKQSVSILDAASPDKGQAVEIQFRQSGCERAIFVGDDATDEDVFARDWGGTVLGIAVGTRKSAATYHLRNQAEIDRLLDRLAALREPAAGA